jgi:hypothetical protein
MKSLEDLVNNIEHEKTFIEILIKQRDAFSRDDFNIEGYNDNDYEQVYNAYTTIYNKLSASLQHLSNLLSQVSIIYDELNKDVFVETLKDGEFSMLIEQLEEKYNDYLNYRSQLLAELYSTFSQVHTNFSKNFVNSIEYIVSRSDMDMSQVLPQSSILSKTIAVQSVFSRYGVESLEKFIKVVADSAKSNARNLNIISNLKMDLRGVLKFIDLSELLNDNLGFEIAKVNGYLISLQYRDNINRIDEDEKRVPTRMLAFDEISYIKYILSSDNILSLVKTDIPVLYKLHSLIFRLNMDEKQAIKEYFLSAKVNPAVVDVIPQKVIMPVFGRENINRMFAETIVGDFKRVYNLSKYLPPHVLDISPESYIEGIQNYYLNSIKSNGIYPLNHEKLLEIIYSMDMTDRIIKERADVINKYIKIINYLLGRTNLLGRELADNREGKRQLDCANRLIDVNLDLLARYLMFIEPDKILFHRFPFENRLRIALAKRYFELGISTIGLMLVSNLEGYDTLIKELYSREVNQSNATITLGSLSNVNEVPQKRLVKRVVKKVIKR